MEGYQSLFRVNAMSDLVSKLWGRGVAYGFRMESENNRSVPEMTKCNILHREDETVISNLEGTLLRDTSPFPYYMLVAFEAGGVLRAATLLVASPLAWLLDSFVSKTAGIKLLTFITFAGLKVQEIELVARAVLPKFYIEDLHSGTWRVFSAFGKRYVVTAVPRIMVEHFAKEYLKADAVLGTEIKATSGRRTTGFVEKPGVLDGKLKALAMAKVFGNFGRVRDCSGLQAISPGARQPDVGLGDRTMDSYFRSFCQETYMVPSNGLVPAVAMEQLPKPLVFHDGRLVRRPTPLVALCTLLWAPFGFLLAVARIGVVCLLPMSLYRVAYKWLGIRVVVNGKPPAAVGKGSRENKLGVLFACSHRTLLDPIFLSVALGRPVTAVTYSISRMSKFLSPIRTVPLDRNREADAAKIQKLLEEGDLVICPEGTTCREPFLLRFSSLFAQLADRIVPVAMQNRMSMFHGTTARGSKCMDPFYFFMNPFPVYEVTFLEQLPPELTCAGGKSAIHVANHIQRLLGATLNFTCTNFTRKDKYQALAGNDGFVPA